VKAQEKASFVVKAQEKASFVVKAQEKLCLVLDKVCFVCILLVGSREKHFAGMKGNVKRIEGKNERFFLYF
jgi:hypothetical protein